MPRVIGLSFIMALAPFLGRTQAQESPPIVEGVREPQGQNEAIEIWDSTTSPDEAFWEDPDTIIRQQYAQIPDTTVGTKTQTAEAPQAPNGNGERDWDFGGRFQLLGYYRDFIDPTPGIEAASLQLRRFSLDLQGHLLPRLKLVASVRLDPFQSGNLDEAFVEGDFHPLARLRAGQFRKPFSREELTPTTSLLTVEKTRQYNGFLRRQTGYLGFDLGVELSGEWADGLVGYQAAVFKGKPSEDGYDYRPGVGDEGVRAKDLSLRLTASPLPAVSFEAAIATKTADDPTSDLLEVAWNTAYQFGAGVFWEGAGLEAEVAFGDNHWGRDSLILDGHTNFFAFYVMPYFRLKLGEGRRLEWVLRWEGIDPNVGGDFASKGDGTFEYYAGVNLGYAEGTAALLGFSAIQPVGFFKKPGDWTHQAELMWRTSW